MKNQPLDPVSQSSSSADSQLDRSDGDRLPTHTALEDKNQASPTTLVPVESPTVSKHQISWKYKLMAIAFLALGAFCGVMVERQESSPTPTKNQNPVNHNSQPKAIETLPASYGDPIYNITTAQHFPHSPKLKQIIDRAVKTVAAKGLPAQDLSISLIDMQAQTTAGYQQNQLRYPASVTKLFWMVAAYGYIEQLNLKFTTLDTDIARMIQASDNDAASRVIDTITKAESGSHLDAVNLKAWLNKRQKINTFFRAANYKNINIDQKTYPIDYLQLTEPQGRELQIRGKAHNPRRNQVSTAQTARLLAEIVSNKAISPADSQRMLSLMNLDWLTRQEKINAANSSQFNPVVGFFSQSLPQDVDFAHKAGWTSQERNEAAYIKSKDGKVAYILVVFGENSAYAQDWSIFPQLSDQIYQQMNSGELKQK